MTPKSFVMTQNSFEFSRLKKVLSRGLIKSFVMKENNFVMKEKIFVMVKIILSWQVWATVESRSSGDIIAIEHKNLTQSQILSLQS